MFSWPVPSEPWSRLHIDYAGPFLGKYWLVVIDAYTKWLEVVPMFATNTMSTIKVLRDIFARFGLPKSVVSDNGPQFTSFEFKQFCEKNNVKHIRSTPYHPRTNGLVERAIRTFKEKMRAAKPENDLKLQLNKFLFSYRNGIRNSTGRSPAELMFGRRLRTRLDLLKPDVNNNLDISLNRQKIYHDRGTNFREFEEEEEVWVLNINGKGYIGGKIKKKTGPYSYIVEIGNKFHRKHSDQLRTRKSTHYNQNNNESQFFNIARPENHPTIITNEPPSNLCEESTPMMKRTLPPRNRRPPDRWSYD